MIRAKVISPREVIEAYLAQVEEINPKLNAIVTLAPDVVSKAEEAEAAIMRGDAVGPLHGVPLTIKDTIETAGLRSTSGSLMRENFIPLHDAPAVARLKAAGAIILGKTNAAEMAMDYNADNPVFGRTNHPQDVTLTPGGSSGGEAAAIATHMSPGGLGSDLAGSVRIPAHFCGIAGLKPTVGRVPGEGHFPPSIGPYRLGSVIGPMARTVSDLDLLFGVISARQEALDSSWEARRATRKATRVAWYADDAVTPVTHETRAAVEAAARALAEHGFVVDARRPPVVDRGNEMWLKLFSRASVVQLRSVYRGNEDKGGDFVRWRLATADDTAQTTLDEFITNWAERDRLRAELIHWMEDTPLLLAPVGATTAFAHGLHKLSIGGQKVGTFRAFSYCQTFNVFDLPVVVVPVARSAEGLPIGVQIIGRPFEEEMVLAAASILEESISFHSSAT